jgi:hypothetical protein
MTSLTDNSEDIEVERNRFQEDIEQDSIGSTGDALSQTGSSHTGTTKEEIKEGLASEDTRHVLRMRILVMLILVATGFTLSVTLYYIVHTTEIETFETEYEGNAESIIKSFNRM